MVHSLYKAPETKISCDRELRGNFTTIKIYTHLRNTEAIAADKHLKWGQFQKMNSFKVNCSFMQNSGSSVSSQSV